jgi:hypothetical protein
MVRDVRTGGAGQSARAGFWRASQARYLPIADHGLIGDLHTAALVGTDGTIDWYCCRRFDWPSIFAAILDADHGGHFRISPDSNGWNSKQLYLPDTNVLITRFLMPEGVAEVQDFMPPARIGQRAHRHRIIRRILDNPTDTRRAREDALSGRRRAPFRLFPHPPPGCAHPARRAVPLSGAAAQLVSALPAEDCQRWRRPRANRYSGSELSCSMMDVCNPRRKPARCQRSRPEAAGAVLHDPPEIAERVATMVGRVTAVDGSVIPIGMESVCVHGDSPGVVQIATVVRERVADRRRRRRPVDR